MKGFLHRK